MTLRHAQLLAIYAIDLYALWCIYQAGKRDERRVHRGSR